jgi:hypothetical protein
VAQKRGVEAQVFFQSKGEKAARQLQRPDITVFGEGLGAVAGADAQKRKIPPPRKGLEVAAGVGYSIDFMKGVRKVGHTGLKKRC